jgi:23S rRNA pseudouridine955/2504/2580 synthase
MSNEMASPAVHFLSIDENQAGQRIDNFLLARLKGVPKSRIYRIIRKGEVRVNKKKVKPEYKLQTSDLVRVPPVRVAESKALVPPSKQLEDLIKGSILYEDEDLLILNKPSGLPVHAGTGVKIGLIEALRYIFSSEPSLELAHRLDKGTSGCIMVAKHSKALRALNLALKQGEVSKTYHAVVFGQWPKTVTEVSAPLYKNQPRSGERFVEVSQEGKAALTRFSILQEFKEFTLIEAKPVTGRTHQIRVHAQYVGHSISGDEKYSEASLNSTLKSKGLGRLCLHAAQLRLQHPMTNKALEVRAPYDEQLEKVMSFLLRST